MAKEYDIIEVGYIGSFIQERADNDGYDIKKSISLGVPDNNVWVINPRTGVLESVVSKGDTNDPQFVQFNGTKPTSPTTDLVIKYIGKTIKVVNTLNTEICVSQSFSGSNYTYQSGGTPPEYKSCEKAIYFTSNNMIQWPMEIQTQNMLKDLSKKIPYDIGFSERYYKIAKLTHEQLLEVQKETKVSYEFLKNLTCLFLFDSEYPESIDNSNIKIGFDWDGFSIDKNDANNLVYSDYHKKTNVENTKFVFLVTDQHIKELTQYFKDASQENPSQFQEIVYYNPIEFIKMMRMEPVNYGRLHAFPESEVISGNLNANNVLDAITKKPMYKMDPTFNDMDLVEDIVTTQIFGEIRSIFDVNSEIIVGTGQADNLIQVEPFSLEALPTLSTEVTDKINELTDAFSKYSITDAIKMGIVNRKIYTLLYEYFRFQAKENYPRGSSIRLNLNEFGALILDSPFISFINQTEDQTEIPVGADEELILENVPNLLSSLDSIYKRFNFTTDYSISDQFHKTRPLFLYESDRTNQFYYDEPNDYNKKYYVSVYNRELSDIRSMKIFDIAYAHISGSGSSYKETKAYTETEHLPAKSMYKKYMAECFGGAENIKFKNGKSSDYFYVLQFDRNAFKDKINSGNIQITLAPISSSSVNSINTGSNFEFDQNSNSIFTLIDDSMYSKIYSSSFETTDECYNLVSGTIQDGAHDYENSGAWGLVFPNKGLIILDGTVLDASCSFNTVTASIDGDNPRKLFLSISGSCSPNIERTEHGYWYMRSSELYSDENYFCRINRDEFNYSNNYTYVTGSSKAAYYDKVNGTTKTYITSIGLYNNSNQLLAVAKFSRPFLKDSSEEYVINVKIRYT
jgi:hypothetical protein